MAQAVLDFFKQAGFKPAVSPDQQMHPLLHPFLTTFSIDCYIQIPASRSHGWGTRLYLVWIKWAQETHLPYGVNSLLLV